MSGPAATRPLLERVLGDWVGTLDRATLKADVMAAPLAAVLVLPQAIAFATLVGVPAAWGLNAAIVAGAVAALAGSSRHVLTGPTNALSLALAASLAPLAAAGSPAYLELVLLVTLMVGAVQLVVALTRLGSLTHFVSPSVLLGFTTGAAVLIAWQGLQGILGWPQGGRFAALVAGVLGVPSGSLAAFGSPGPPDAPGAALPPLQVAALGTGLVTLALAVMLRRLWPRGPHLLLALAGGTLASLALARLGPVARVGALPSPWPQFALPTMAWPDVPRLVRELLPIALALTIVALGQSIAIAKALAAKSGQVLDVNRECLGQGLGNLAAGLFSGFASCGSLNRSVPHQEAGARTPLAAVLSSLLLLALVALAARWLAWIPIAAISALLLLVAWSLIDRAAWREARRLDTREAVLAAATAVATLVLPLEQAVLLGVVASFVLYLHRTAHPALRTMGFDRPPEAPAAAGGAPLRPFVVLDPAHPRPRSECPQLKMLRMEGSVWFGAVSHVQDALRALRGAPQPPPHLLVMTKSMNFIDPAGAALWEAERQARVAMGGGLYFHRPRPEVMALWGRSGFVERLGVQHLFADKRSAIAAIVPRLDPAICARCRERVFEECADRPDGVSGREP